MGFCWKVAARYAFKNPSTRKPQPTKTQSPSKPESTHTHMALWDKDCMVYSCYNARLLNHTVPLCERTQWKWLELFPLYSLNWKAVIASAPEPGTKRAPHQRMVVQSRLPRVNSKKDKPQDKVRALKFLFVTSRYHEFDINRQDQWMSSSTLHSNLNLQSTKNGARFTSESYSQHTSLDWLHLVLSLI